MWLLFFSFANLLGKVTWGATIQFPSGEARVFLK